LSFWVSVTTAEAAKNGEWATNSRGAGIAGAEARVDFAAFAARLKRLRKKSQSGYFFSAAGDCKEEVCVEKTRSRRRCTAM
jgi:hypothetical protein